MFKTLPMVAKISTNDAKCKEKILIKHFRMAAALCSSGSRPDHNASNIFHDKFT